MREMRMLGLGQYAHNNQPVHHLPFLYALLGDRNSTAKLVRQILATAYSPEGFAGDEDNGEMGAWFVLSALGLYSTAPGVTEDYVLAAVPLFRRVHVKALDLTIEAPAASEDYPMIAQVLWQTIPVEGATLPFSTLRKGGVLRFIAPGDTALGHKISAARGAINQVAKKANTALRQVGNKVSNAAKQVANKAGATKPPPTSEDEVPTLVAPPPPKSLDQWDSDLGDGQLAGAKGYVIPKAGSFPQDEGEISESTAFVVGFIALFLMCCIGGWRLLGRFLSSDKDDREPRISRRGGPDGRSSVGSARARRSGRGDAPGARRGAPPEREPGSRTRRGLPLDY